MKLFKHFPNQLSVIEQQDYQNDFLRFLLNRTGVDQKVRDQVFGRWLKKGMPKIKDFAPYAYYCLTVYLSFYIGIAKNLIGTKPSNIIDLEYVLYMPFCKVFASTDKFHRDFSQIFLADGQDFVWGNDLKDDLNWHSELGVSYQQMLSFPFKKLGLKRKFVRKEMRKIYMRKLRISVQYTKTLHDCQVLN